ncbi:MarR family winged helix-turn-helix transcriptional regulator [Nocardioides jiangxiensis]|uniref:MarR family transcriptional regulator n=1 Tax=Nocardioides jiangxiensis TaxID=3064524 RepID=A0ABT9B2P5_9ACTN|nr:MarR family transcriptional regulator [Nocardioides sp. WY-20]MDO7869035.1 MarR family transcriptional regulator [Nocardioides sp. WY-20]
MAERRWLDDDEQRAWRSFLVASTLLSSAIDDAAKRHDISGGEYAVLVRLSEAPGGELRMAQLADGLLHSRSRVTHTIKRMEAKGLVDRADSAEDGRGVVARLTEAGRQRLVDAAPDHVAVVRRHLFDLVGREDMLAFGRVMDAVADDLDAVSPEANRIR